MKLDDDTKMLLYCTVIPFIAIIVFCAVMDYVSTCWKRDALERHGVVMTTWDVWVLDPHIRIIEGKAKVEYTE